VEQVPCSSAAAAASLRDPQEAERRGMRLLFAKFASWSGAITSSGSSLKISSAPCSES
jgi:hypothetical protein